MMLPSVASGVQERDTAFVAYEGEKLSVPSSRSGSRALPLSMTEAAIYSASPHVSEFSEACNVMRAAELLSRRQILCVTHARERLKPSVLPPLGSLFMYGRTLLPTAEVFLLCLSPILLLCQPGLGDM